MNGGGCGAVSSASAFAYFVVLVVLRRGGFRRSKNQRKRHYELQLWPYQQQHTIDKHSITKPIATRHGGKAGGFPLSEDFLGLFFSMTTMGDIYGVGTMMACQMTLDDMPGALGNIGRKMSTATKVR